MGEVWRGRHLGQDVPVAVKVITRARARQGRFVDAFRQEVEAVARLNHPGIVNIYDYGLVSPQAQRSSRGRLTAGSPYLVMEWLEGKQVLAWKPRSWGAVKQILFGVLDALAHAHARDVLHRDIKPGNLLVSGSQKRPRIKLIDFGLAAIDDDESERRLWLPGGTPNFQPPERIRHPERWKEGPWSDLYSLGCTAYTLIAGRPPFNGTTAHSVLMDHLTKPLPPLEPRFPVPHEFDDWLRLITEKEPWRRFRRAADAAYALAGIGRGFDESDMETTATSDVSVVARTTGVPSLATGPPSEASWSMEVALDTVLDSTFGSTEIHHVNALPPEEAVLRSPPVPGHWYREEPPLFSNNLLGVGLALYGLRPLPLVARVEERDLIWSALLRMHEQRRSQTIVVSGAAGQGKSRLVEWICERAHEVGAATILRGVHGEGGGPNDGVAGMVSRYLRCVGAKPDVIQKRVSRLLAQRGWLDDDDVRRFETLILSGREGPEKARTSELFDNPAELWEQVLKLIVAAAERRPAIVWLDDVQWSPETLAAVRYCQEQLEERPAPVLFLLTVRDEALAERPREAVQLARILRHASARRCHLEALGAEDHVRLVRELLALRGSLANEVIERTQGNPLFAAKLVGDWVRRGVLLPSSEGWMLRNGEQALMPSSLFSVWNARLDRLLDEVTGATRQEDACGLTPRQAEVALEIAATLGLEVNLEEWHALTEELDIPATKKLVQLLRTRRLASQTPTGWRFVHAMLREAVERRARDGGRWVEHNRRASKLLLRRNGGANAALRLGRHLLAAGDFQGCLRPMEGAARQAIERGDFNVGLALLDRRDEALDALRRPADDPDRVMGWALRAWAMRALGNDLEGAGMWADRALQLAQQRDWHRVEALAAAELGLAKDQQGQSAEVVELLTRAASLWEKLGDDSQRVRTLRALGFVALARDNLERAADLFESAAQVAAQRAGLRSEALRGLSAVARASGDGTRSRELIEQAVRLASEDGHRLLLAQCQNDLGLDHRYRNDFEEAEASYRAAVQLFESVGSGHAVYPLFNLAIVMLLGRRFVEGREVLERLVRDCERQGQRALLGGAHRLLLVCAAAERDWDSWDRHMGPAAEGLDGGASFTEDEAWATQIAAELAERRGKAERARIVFAMALRMWERLGEPARAEKLRGRFAEREPSRAR